jgi:colanic acid biosynthesis glycosyl transferase WcaI
VHILILNQYYPPDTSATAKMAAQVAETLAERHDVTVLAGRPSYDPDERHPLRLLRRDVRGNVTVERVGSTTFPRHQMRGRVTNYLTYLSLAVPRALAARADLILAMTDPPVAGIAGALIARLTRRPFVYNIRDLYPEMAIGGDIIRPSRWARGWEQLHRRALRQAACVVVLGDDMRDRIVSKGIDPDRVVVVRDGTSIPESLPTRDHPVAKQIRSGFYFVVMHAGNLGFSGAWETLVNAARIVGNDGCGFVFVGDGANRGQIEEAAQGCAQVRLLPFRPAEEIPYVMAAGDVHVVTVRRGLEGVVVPSKLYSILAAGRPVLAVAPEQSDVARIVRQSDCGLVADPDDSAAVACAVRELRECPARLEAMARRAREISHNYVRANELRRFRDVVEQAAHSWNEGCSYGLAAPREESFANAPQSKIESKVKT